MLFYPIEPYFHRGLQFIHSLTAKSFHIKYRWQVSTVQLYGMNKKIGLSHWICLGNKIMICSPNKTIFMCFTEVSGKTRVTMISSLGSLHKNKMNREIGLPVTCQHRPVNISLIMRNVNSMHFVTARYTYAIPLPAITRLPTISIRTDKKPIKRCRKKQNYAYSQHIAQPFRHRTCLSLSFYPASARRTGRRGRGLTACCVSFFSGQNINL